MEKELITQMKAWSRPQLIVLVRSNAEEAVLGACKDSTPGPGGSDCTPFGPETWCLDRGPS